MTCGEIREQLSAFLDGELADGERQAVAAHLEGCEACRREHAALARTVELVRGLPAVAPPADLAGRVAERVAEPPAERTPPFVLRRAILWPAVAATVALALTIFYQKYETVPAATLRSAEETAPAATPAPFRPAVATAKDASRVADADQARGNREFSFRAAPEDTERRSVLAKESGSAPALGADESLKGNMLRDRVAAGKRAEDAPAAALRAPERRLVEESAKAKGLARQDGVAPQRDVAGIVTPAAPPVAAAPSPPTVPSAAPAPAFPARLKETETADRGGIKRDGIVLDKLATAAKPANIPAEERPATAQSIASNGVAALKLAAVAPNAPSYRYVIITVASLDEGAAQVQQVFARYGATAERAAAEQPRPAAGPAGGVRGLGFAGGGGGAFTPGEARTLRGLVTADKAEALIADVGRLSSAPLFGTSALAGSDEKSRSEIQARLVTKPATASTAGEVGQRGAVNPPGAPVAKTAPAVDDYAAKKGAADVRAEAKRPEGEERQGALDQSGRAAESTATRQSKAEAGPASAGPVDYARRRAGDTAAATQAAAQAAPLDAAKAMKERSAAASQVSVIVFLRLAHPAPATEAKPAGNK